jgi:activator of HSP90 ATPase
MTVSGQNGLGTNGRGILMTEQRPTYDFEQSDVIPAAPREVYDAWMSSTGHTAMTGGEAVVDPAIGGEFSAWDGYIWGRTLELDPGVRILQSWRTTEFDEDEPDSRIEVVFEPVGGGTSIRLRHTGVPVDQLGYENGGWRDNYFEPMKAFFGAA